MAAPLLPADHFGSMQLIGLTGGIATGKSTVSRHLQSQGIPVIDADVIAKSVTLPGHAPYTKVVQLFPECIDPETGLIDRAQLGQLVFANPEKRKVLEQAIHPAVIKEMVFQILMRWLQGHERVVVDVPLLYESGLDKYMSYVIVLASDEQTMLKRLWERNQWDEARGRLMIRSQMALDEKCRRAAVVIRNEHSIAELLQEVDQVLEDRKPSLIVHKVGLWLVPIGTGVLVTGLAAYQAYTRFFKPRP